MRQMSFAELTVTTKTQSSGESFDVLFDFLNLETMRGISTQSDKGTRYQSKSKAAP